MGYIRDHLAVVAACGDFIASGGTWTEVVSGGLWACRRTAGAASFYLAVAPRLLQHANTQRGSCLTSIDLYWKVATAALNSLSAAIYLAALPADGSAFENPASQAFSYDSAHDADAERLTAASHTLKLTLTTPIWVANDELVQVELAINAAAGSVFDWYGARFNFTLRL